MKKIALIPAYEPDEKLIELVQELNQNNYQIVVVDDGSGKDYNHIFNSLKAKIITYEENKGKGYALKTGLKYIQKTYPESIVVTLDADGQHKVKDADNLCKYIEKNPKELALGSRYRSKKTPLRSKLGNTITMLIFKLVTGQKIYDTQTGLRVFHTNLIPYLLEIKGNRYEYEMNVLLNLKKYKIKSTEIPIEVIYFENNKSSHFKTIRDSYLIYKEILKFSGSSIISFIIDYLMYSILFITTKGIVISNVLARTISGTTNYKINKNLVFQNQKKNKNQFLYYILLAIAVLILNTLILKTFVTYTNLNAFISKIITEIILFILSYKVQKKYIFA